MNRGSTTGRGGVEIALSGPAGAAKLSWRFQVFPLLRSLHCDGPPSIKPGCSGPFPAGNWPELFCPRSEMWVCGELAHESSPWWWGQFPHAASVPSMLKWGFLLYCRVAVCYTYNTSSFSYIWCSLSCCHFSCC